MEPAVNIYNRYYVKDIPVYHLRYIIQFSVIGQEPVCKVKAHLSCLYLIAMNVSVGVDAGF